MTSWQVLVAHAVKVLVLVTLAGILTRRRAGLCWSFVAYLAVVLTANSLVSFWPERFFAGWFWMLQAALYDALKMAIAAELAYRTFKAFPAAQATARRVLFLALLGTSLAAVGVPKDSSYPAAFVELEPRILTGTIWLMTGLTLLIVWYRVPLNAFHKAILLGFVPYLLVFTSLLRLLEHYGWEILPVVQSAEPVAYMLMVGWWAAAAWQPDSVAEVSPALLRKLYASRARS